MTFTVGQRFGNLTVNSVSPVMRSKSAHIACKCDCGKDVLVRSFDLKRQFTRSCGCYKKAKDKLLQFQSSEDRFLSLYKRHARATCREFRLTNEEAIRMFKMPCGYCGALPSKNSLRSGIKIAVNGIDRLDNKLGYIPGNVITACTTCNMMKHTMGVKEFLAQVSRIANRESRYRRLINYLRNLWCSI